jgi:hypothetical protein
VAEQGGEVIAKPKRLSAKVAKKRAWDAFSLYIRERDGICVFHEEIAKRGIPAPCKCAGVLQCCHIISRSKASLLFDEQNVFAGCAGSNTWAHFHEAEWDRLWRATWPYLIEHLDRMKDVRCQRKVNDYLNIAEHYRRETDKLRRQA